MLRNPLPAKISIELSWEEIRPAIRKYFDFKEEDLRNRSQASCLVSVRPAAYVASPHQLPLCSSVILVRVDLLEGIDTNLSCTPMSIGTTQGESKAEIFLDAAPRCTRLVCNMCSHKRKLGIESSDG